MNDTATTTHLADDDFELLLRRRIHALADHAPSSVPADAHTARPVATRPRRRRAAGIGATIAALVGAAGITTVALNGAGSGGASTPNEAVLQFVDALDHEDLLGMIDVIDPAEVTAVRAAVEEGATEAKRVDLLADSFALDGVAGLDIEIADLALSTEQLDADLAVVTATSGTLTTRFDPAQFPFGESVRELLGDAVPTESTDELGEANLDIRLATVQRDGRWYVSVSYTVAEYARRGGDAQLPAAPGVAAEGFASAEDAVTAFYERLAALDVEGLVATAAPGEGDAMARYASLWLPGAREAADRVLADGLRLDISGLVFDTVRESGAERILAASAFVIEGTLPASVDSESTSDAPLAIRIERADGCTTWSGPAATAMLAGGVDAVFAPGFESIGPDTLRSCANAPLGVASIIMVNTGGLTELPSVAAVEVDGQWYVSPIGTLASEILELLRDVPDGASLFDSELGRFLFGTSRSSLESNFVGRPLAEMTPECAALFTVDEVGVVTGVVAEPDLSLVRHCAGTMATGSSQEGAPAPEVSYEVAATEVATTVVEPVETGG